MYDPALEQLDVLSRALDLSIANGDDAGRGNAEYWLGYVKYALGQSRAAIRHFEDAYSRASDKGDTPFVRNLAATLGQAYASACDYRVANEYFDLALNRGSKPSAQTRPSTGSAYTLACKGAVLGDQGLFDDAAECFAEALAGVKGTNHVVEGSVLCLQSLVLVWQGCWEEANATALSAEKVATRARSLYLLGMSRSLGARAEWVQFRRPAAVSALAEATGWIEKRGRGLFSSLNHGWLAEAYAEQGNAAGVRTQLKRALRRAREGDHLGEAVAWRAVARLSAAGVMRISPEKCMLRADRAAERRGSPHEQALNHLERAELATARGYADLAQHLRDQARTAFDRMHMRWHLAEMDRK